MNPQEFQLALLNIAVNFLNVAKDTEYRYEESIKTLAIDLAKYLNNNISK